MNEFDFDKKFAAHFKNEYNHELTPQNWDYIRNQLSSYQRKKLMLHRFLYLLIPFLLTGYNM